MRVALVAAAVAALAFPVGADELVWTGSGDATSAELTLGYPNSDYIPLAFWCVPDVDVVYVAYEFIPRHPVESMAIDFTLKSGDTIIHVAAEGRTIAIDDSFLLEGQIPFGQPFIDLISTGESLVVTSEGIEKQFSLDGARQAAGPLLAMCKGS
jgi:hypothetical protein